MSHLEGMGPEGIGPNAGGDAPALLSRVGDLLTLLARPPLDQRPHTAIRVALERDVAINRMFDRLDFVLRGRVFSTSPIREIGLRVEGAPVARILLAPASAGSDGRHEHCFAMQASRPGGQGPASFAFVLVVRGADGSPHETAGTIAAEPDEARARVAPGAAMPADPDRPFAPGVMLYVERALIEADGTLVVHGWSLARAPIVLVAIAANETPAGAARIGVERADVAAIFPDYPDGHLAGFSCALPLGEAGRRTARVAIQAIGGDGASQTTIVAPERGAVPSTLAGADPAPPVAEAADILFKLDEPASLAPDLAIEVAGLLSLRGWVLARAGVDRLSVAIGGTALGEAELGLARPDVLAAHPDWAGASHGGFVFCASLAAIPNGPHTARLLVRDRDGATRAHDIPLLVRKSHAALRERAGPVQQDLYRDTAARLGAHAAFGLLLRRDGAWAEAIASGALDRTLASLRAQMHTLWRLAIYPEDGPTGDGREKAVLLDWIARHHADLAPRITVGDDPDGAPRTVDLLGVLGAGDTLGCDALAEVAIGRGLHPAAEMFYADDIRISPATGQLEPFFKPDFSPELLLATNYIGRPWFVSPGLLARCGIAADAWPGLGDYDAVLRASELAAAIHHIPLLLCQRHAPTLDDAAAERAALAAAAARRGMDTDVLSGAVAGSYRLRRRCPVPGLVSIVIPVRAVDDTLRACLAGLRATTAFRPVEIVAIDTIAPGQPADRAWLADHADIVVDAPGPFDRSRANTLGAARARGDHLLFLADDIVVEDAEWLDTLLEQAARPGVGVVAPRLLSPDGTVRHAGLFVATGGQWRHAFAGQAREAPGYFGLARTPRNVSAVSDACLLTSRRVFDAAGGFGEARTDVAGGVDFCRRVRKAGLRAVCCPDATLTRHERGGQAGPPCNSGTAVSAAGDPYHNPNLAQDADDARPDEEATHAVFAGHPLFRHDEITRILAVKLDHIGDVVTALPALRRLRRHFPTAHITLLAHGLARGLAGAEPAVDAFVGFEFYDARSQNGLAPRVAADFADLRARLAPHRFDLAIDLRKHPDTRDVLRHVPARFLAGFDTEGRFPFLDVALEWEADRALLRKRGHVADDLLNLVDAVLNACRSETPAPKWAAPSQDATGLAATDPTEMLRRLPAQVAALWAHPVVAVHTGVGNVMRQWPARHFVDLIDLLIARNDVSVVLVGGEDERGLADDILARVAQPGRAASLTGRTSLPELAGVLRHCALFVGNNSGPHHIAAALGVPTLGIHSGLVDAAEWGPLGPRALALTRRMSCGPCYLATPEQCPRGLACLHDLAPSVAHRHAEWLLARPAPGGPQP